jgi:hypothetical protein
MVAVLVLFAQFADAKDQTTCKSAINDAPSVWNYYVKNVDKLLDDVNAKIEKMKTSDDDYFCCTTGDFVRPDLRGTCPYLMEKQELYGNKNHVVSTLEALIPQKDWIRGAKEAKKLSEIAYEINSVKGACSDTQHYTYDNEETLQLLDKVGLT